MALPLRDDHGRRAVPWITLGLIAINVLVFLFVQPVGFQSGASDEPTADRRAPSQEALWQVRDRDVFTYRYGAVACEVVTGETLAERPEGCHGEVGDHLPDTKSIALSLLTAMFLHGSIGHLAGNMLFLWVFGARVEQRLGRGNFLGLYVFGGVLATLGYVALNTTSTAPLVGASGAIAVVMGTYLVLFPRGRVLTVIATAAFQVVYVPASVVLALFFVTQFFTSDEQVAWEAHAAGMVVGALAGLVLARIPAIRHRGELEREDALLRSGREF
ncbi:MAG: rhomboid family intramembrane serine protease [Acidimicrobiales bacterium]